MKSRFHLTLILISCFLLPCLCGCDVHEFPSVNEGNHFILHLTYDTELPLYKTVYYEDGNIVGSPTRSDDYSIRYVINFYSAKGRAADSPKYLYSYTFTRPVSSGLDADFAIDVPPGDYQIMVWTDYVKEGRESETFYDTSDFAEIILSDRKDYQGATDYRDAFKGTLEKVIDYDLPVADKNGERNVEATIPMSRPLAKYSIIAEDFDDFITKQAKATDISRYTARIVYPMYMPCAYNMFSDRNVDSWTGIAFDCPVRQISDHEVEIGFDYVFANEGDASVTVAIELYRDGELMGSSSSFNIPLRRSMLTEVKGAFLTTLVNGGVGIDPDFNGDYNIVIK